MKALFLGHFAAGVAPRILAKVKTPLEASILDDEGDAAQLAPLLSEAEIVVGHIWRPSFPPAPRLRLLQSVAAGLDLLDIAAVPKGVTICNVFAAGLRIARCWATQSASSATAGSGVRLRSAPRDSNAASLLPTAARSPVPRRPIPHFLSLTSIA